MIPFKPNFKFLFYAICILAVCQCKKSFTAPSGAQVPSCGDSSPACIVDQPSSCSDLQESEDALLKGVKISREACIIGHINFGT